MCLYACHYWLSFTFFQTVLLKCGLCWCMCCNLHDQRSANDAMMWFNALLQRLPQSPSFIHWLTDISIHQLVFVAHQQSKPKTGFILTGKDCWYFEFTLELPIVYLRLLTTCGYVKSCGFHGNCSKYNSLFIQLINNINFKLTKSFRKACWHRRTCSAAAYCLVIRVWG